jgi:hypothetical protein
MRRMVKENQLKFGATPLFPERVASPRSSASRTIALSAKRAPERNSRSNCPLSCKSSIRPSVAITCWHTAAPSRRLSTICR